MATRKIGIIVEGATGRLGSTQHLRSLMAIRSEGGLAISNGDRLLPQPVLLGRNAEKLAGLAAANGGLKWSTDRDASLADREIAIYFDAGATGGRAARAAPAPAPRKHTYVQKPPPRTPPPGPPPPRPPPPPPPPPPLRRCAGPGAPRRARPPQSRCRAGQAVFARARQTAQAVRSQFLWPRAVDPIGFRLVGLRWHALPGAAPELELPQGDWGRTRPRYVR